MDPFSLHKGDRLLNQQLGIDYKRDKKVKLKPGRKPKQIKQPQTLWQQVSKNTLAST